MDLDPTEKSRVWWSGTLKGATKGLLMGIAIGVGSALLLQFAILPALSSVGFSAVSQIFTGFLMPGGSFSPFSLAIFSGVSGLMGGLLGGGNAAVAAHHSQKYQQFQEAKIHELEGREQLVEQAITKTPRIAQSILAGGQRNMDSFAEAELARQQNTTAQILH
jgi:hypothetical protein